MQVRRTSYQYRPIAGRLREGHSANNGSPFAQLTPLFRGRHGDVGQVDGGHILNLPMQGDSRQLLCRSLPHMMQPRCVVLPAGRQVDLKDRLMNRDGFLKTPGLFPSP